MGLDPNKHKIGQVVLLNFTNSDAKRECHDFNKSDCGNCRRSDVQEQTSDCQTFDSECGVDSCLPDLNLDLTIGPPSQLGYNVH